jgi:hypothetical protein
MKIDYDKYAGYEFCPKLKNITNEVFCKMPQLTFRARKIDQNKSAIIGVDVFEKMHNVGFSFLSFTKTFVVKTKMLYTLNRI